MSLAEKKISRGVPFQKTLSCRSTLIYKDDSYLPKFRGDLGRLGPQYPLPDVGGDEAGWSFG